MDRSLQRSFGFQRGHVTAAQARAGGLTARQIRYRVAKGAWVRVHPSVFRDASHPETWEGKLVAAALALGEGAVVSHRAAVGVWGLYDYRPFLVELSVPHHNGVRLDGATVHRLSDLRPRDVARKDGIPVTKPARTLLDTAAVARRPFIERCLEEWLADRVVTIAEVRTCIDEHRGRGRRGVGVLRDVLESRVLGDAVADSATEALLAKVLRSNGVELPEHHHEVTPAGADYELDYAYPDHRLAIEVDGYGVHMRSKEIFESDRHRQNELEIAGWRVLRFTKGALEHEPLRVASQVARMLAS
jgi:very-short-patch-repair endonuclease